MTAFYIARAWFVVFTGKGHAHGSAEPTRGLGEISPSGGHESPPIMIAPLMVLAALSITAGYLGIPAFLGQHHGEFHWDVAAVSLAVVAAGLALAWLMYGRSILDPQRVVRALALPYHLFQRRLYIDELYSWYVATVQQRVFAGACAFFEQTVIIGFAVNGTAALTRGLGYLVRRLQTGMVQFYVLAFAAGIVALLSAVVR
jgi:NADH:ubiquinone oxidoreductase subunit 5 (subunit L)/multisubunit Na+/H+ antiporter MnhA subunit